MQLAKYSTVQQYKVQANVKYTGITLGREFAFGLSTIHNLKIGELEISEPKLILLVFKAVGFIQ